MPREWNNPTREPWNTPIHSILKTVDTHVSMYLSSGDEWHLRKAQILREYVSELKDWIHEQESAKSHSN